MVADAMARDRAILAQRRIHRDYLLGHTSEHLRLLVERYRTMAKEDYGLAQEARKAGNDRFEATCLAAGDWSMVVSLEALDILREREASN